MMLRPKCHKKCDDKFIRLYTIPALDRQTYGRIYHNNIALCMHCMLTLDKNHVNRVVSETGFCAYLLASDLRQLSYRRCRCHKIC